MPKTRTPSEKPGRAAAPIGVDPDRHQSGQTIAHDSFALPTDSLPAVRRRSGGPALTAKGLWQMRPKRGAWRNYSEGSIERAVELADPELWTFRNPLNSAWPRKDRIAFHSPDDGEVSRSGRQGRGAQAAAISSNHRLRRRFLPEFASRQTAVDRETPMRMAPSKPPSTGNRTAEIPAGNG